MMFGIFLDVFNENTGDTNAENNDLKKQNVMQLYWIAFFESSLKCMGNI